MADKTKDNGIVVVINADGSVYPFTELFNPANESDDELRDLIETYLEKQGRKIGTFYKVI